MATPGRFGTHFTLLIEGFIALPKMYGIKHLADIRTVPRSGRKLEFNGDALADALIPENIDYAPLRALGGLRHARKNSPKFGSLSDALSCGIGSLLRPA